MVAEQIVERIKLEYQLSEVREVSSFDEALQIISIYRNEVSNNLETLPSVISRNKRLAFFSNILGRFRSEFGYLMPEVYMKDNDLIALESTMLWEYRRCFDRINYFTNEDNYQEMCHFADFTYRNYRKNYTNMEKSRDINLEDSNKLAAVVLRAPLDKDSFYSFFDSEIEEISGVKCFEFSKKWWNFQN